MPIKIKFTLSLSALFIALAPCIAFAQTEAITAYIPVHQGDSVYNKRIKLNPVLLPPKSKRSNTSHLRNTSPQNNERDDLPAQAIASMENVPVLDQGDYGTCVTFAVTAALDSIKGKGDSISQLCLLQMSRYLESIAYNFENGWEGTQVEDTIDTIKHYGTMSKQAEKTQSCGGLTSYPDKDSQTASLPGYPMPLTDYKKMSEDVLGPTKNWYFDANPLLPNVEHAQLNRVKEVIADSIAYGNKVVSTRVFFSFFLPGGKWLIKYCGIGACAKYHASNDTWAFTKEMAEDTDDDYHAKKGGHTLIIYGYDDNAIATDDKGRTHKGLLYLRNSWGNKVGDHGDYYMTYDFFEQVADGEIQILSAYDVQGR